MNKIIITVIIAGVIIVAALTGAAWYFMQGSASAPQGGSDNTPVGGAVSSGGTVTTGSSQTPAGSQQAGISVQGQNGAAIPISDFIHASGTVADPNNQGQYFLKNTGQVKSAAPYNILYVAADQSFTVALIEEPIGSARLEAEAALEASLGITETQMCNLRYAVLVPASVNTYYSGRNLGFSFCPGAEALQ